MIRQTVPFFGVSSMADSLSHYVDHLGFTLNHTWEPDGQIRWCWLQHAGGASLMMQQHYTEGLNARVYEGVLGEGIRFAYLEAPSRDVASASEMSDNWPFDGLASIADCFQGWREPSKGLWGTLQTRCTGPIVPRMGQKVGRSLRGQNEGPKWPVSRIRIRVPTFTKIPLKCLQPLDQVPFE